MLTAVPNSPVAHPTRLRTAWARYGPLSADCSPWPSVNGQYPTKPSSREDAADVDEAAHTPTSKDVKTTLLQIMVTPSRATFAALGCLHVAGNTAEQAYLVRTTPAVMTPNAISTCPRTRPLSCRLRSAKGRSFAERKATLIALPVDNRHVERRNCARQPPQEWARSVARAKIPQIGRARPAGGRDALVGGHSDNFPDLARRVAEVAATRC